MVRVRVGALLAADGGVCLIRRERPDGVQYSLPGGLVEAGEDAFTALHRELREELGLNAATAPEAPALRWVQDQATTRPGRDGVFRRRHLVFLLHLPPSAREGLATVELDATDRAAVVWCDPLRAAGLHLYPAVGSVLAPGAAARTRPVLLPPMTDTTYRWR
ncbi:NUDIX hydrolase [Kitasatospora sp. DSM 101779]|uniref:NUDIX hydrolase n=1 Tax=Kitasatospora sp. DSM 101779 TaxID=2853165 RepID=UPI0021D8037B|nr:NUDIX hydrolase [Kitasatospora sp. DSM 101779]MCU7826955.1 NUDIX hydrolase [Kitasatospora sp. DSM 101779]